MENHNDVDPSLDKSIQRAIGLGEALTADQKSSILEMRAKQLAIPMASEEEGSSESLRVIAFHVGEETYAFPADSVSRVDMSIPITPVPCVPEFLAGITNLRGHIRSVVHLATFLGINTDAPSEFVLVAQYDDMEVAFLVGALDEVTDVMVRDIKPRPPVGNGNAHQYIAGLVPGGLILLDLAAIFTDERFIVNDEVA